MDIEIKKVNFENFLRKCCFSKIVNDLVVKTEGNKLFARFSDEPASLYGQVYEDQVKINEQGSMFIANTGKLIDALERISSEVIRLKTSESKFLITDGSKPGKCKTTFAQLGAESFVESYARIEGLSNLVDPNSRAYIQGKHPFDDGFEVSITQLDECLKDAKMFRLELYTFSEKDGIFNCTISDDSIGESFRRNIITEKKLGGTVGRILVGKGFREMIGALKSVKVDEKNKDQKYGFYINDLGLMITDNKTFYYVLHAVEE